MNNQFVALDQVLLRMDLEFVGSARHKVSVEQLFCTPGAQMLDVRTAAEHEALPLLFPGQVEMLHIPLNHLPQRWSEIDTSVLTGIFCPHGVRASVAYTYLCARGMEHVAVIEGGYAALTEMARPGVVLKCKP